MNPYEKTSQEMKRQSEGPKRFSKKALGVGLSLGAASFAPILSRAIPFLNQYIPESLAIKGLSKISPNFGNFIKKAFDSGYDFNEIKDFIGNQVNESKETTKENRNIIEQYSPELHQYLDQEIRNGRPWLQAGDIAQNDKRFSSIINKISNDHKTPWSKILESIYGQGLSQQQSQQAQEAQSQGSGQGQQALMEILQKIQQSRGM